VADRTVKIVLDANIQGLQGKLKAASSSASEFGGKLSKGLQQNAQHVDQLSNKAGLLGAGLVGMFGLAAKKAADFDQAMSGVAATGEDARKSISALRDAALDAGARTVFSATEAANAITELAKAGVSTADILNGGLDGALNLAAAGEIEVARAAEIASQTMNQFSLTGADSTRIADVLAASAGKAAGEVDDFGVAMKYIGPVASGLGVSLEETAGTLALLAQNGILADSAGTGLRGVMMSLTAPTAIAQKELDKYNISAFDAQGKFVGMESLVGQLETRLGGLSDAERKAALGRMFGNEQITAAEILMREGGDAVAYWTAQVDDQGYAAETAATKLDNLKGDLEALGGATETALIKMGEGANGPLRGLVQGVTDVVNAFSDLPSGVQGAAMTLIGGGGLVALGVAGMGKLVVSISSVKGSLDALKISGKTARVAVAGVGGALGIATLAIAAWASAQADAKARVEEFAATLDEFGGRTEATFETVNDKLSEMRTSWGSGGRSLIDQAAIFGISVEDMQDYVLGVEDATDRVNTAYQKYKDETFGSGPSSIFKHLGNEDAFGAFKTALDEQAAGLSDAEKAAYQNAEANATNTETVDENASAVEKLAAAQATGTSSTETYTDALKELLDQQREAAGGVLDLRDAERNYYSALDEGVAAIEENGRTLDRTTEAGRANQSALDALADSGWDVIDSMREQGATQGDLQAQMGRTRDDFIDLAEKMGMSEGKAEDLADQLGLIPENVDVDVAVNTAGASDAVNRWITTNSGRRVVVTMDLRYPGGQVYQTPGRDMYAAGGSVSGPGTGTSDQIPALLSNGEHVLTADDVRKAGGQGAIYRMRAAIQGGLLRFAAGGAVGDARRDVAAADKARQAAWKKVSTGGWKDADVTAWEKARERWMDAVERLDRLMSQAQEAIVDARRGDTMRSATSSLSGAYGLVDQLRDLANDEDLSQGQRDSFARRAREAEVAFKRLYGQAERIENKLGKARDRVQELASIKASASSALQGGFGIGGLFGQKDAHGYDKPVTGQSILRGAKQYANKLRRFGGKLAKVQKKLGPNSGVILQELVGLGVEEGTLAADAILSLNDREANELTRAYRDIKKYSDMAGETVTKGFYKGGLSAAEGVVDGLEDQADAIARQIENIARRETNAIRRALGLPPLTPSAKRGAPRSDNIGGGQITASSAPRAMSPYASSSGSNSAKVVAQVTAQDAALIGAALAEAWHADPPAAVLALGPRDQARLYQSGKAAAGRIS
jgi:TP901 family phage tail tape measure protein